MRVIIGMPCQEGDFPMRMTHVLRRRGAARRRAPSRCWRSRRRRSRPPRSKAPTTSTSSAMADISRCSSSRKDGVIATDPIALRAPDRRPATYVDEIKKVTDRADQVPDLQPSPLRPRGRRQGRSRMRARASSRTRTSKPHSWQTERPAHRDAGRVHRRQEDASSSAARRWSCSISAATTPTPRW